MGWWNTIVGWARSTWRDIAGVPGAVTSGLESVWHFITSIAQGLDYVLRNPFTSVTNGLAMIAGLVTGNLTAARNAAIRFDPYLVTHHIIPLRQQLIAIIDRVYAQLLAYLKADFFYLLGDINRLRARLLTLLAAERKARIRDFQLSEAYTRQQVKWALAMVQKEAASGYQVTLTSRVSLIAKLADTLVTRNPVVKELVTRIVQGLLDVIAVDNPVLRLVIGFLLTRVIDNMGIDQVTARYVQALATPILGDPKPSNLHDVIKQVGERMDALEGQWAQFMADGGPEILQAGTEWRNITGIITDAGLLAFFALMVTEPQSWAADVAGVGAPVVRSAVAAVTDLL